MGQIETPRHGRPQRRRSHRRGLLGSLPGIAVLLCLDGGISNGSIGKDLDPAWAALHSLRIGLAMTSNAWQTSSARATASVHAQYLRPL